MKTLVAALAVLATTTSAGCAPAPQQKDTAMVEYRQNPNPAKTHRIDMRIENAPGAFGWIQGFMQFDVVNRECLPPPKDNPGGYSSPIPTRSIPFELQRQSDGGYTGTVFTDGMVDEDYHGFGVCRWRLVNVQVQLKATGAPGETLFMADLLGEELSSGDTKTLHYPRSNYPHTTVENYPDFGESDLTEYRPSIRGELFAVTLESEEVAP